MPKRRKRPYIIERPIPKVGQFEMLGECYQGEHTIVINPKQSSREYLGTLVHELAHYVFPDMTEKQVRRIESIFSQALWRQGFRRIMK